MGPNTPFQTQQVFQPYYTNNPAFQTLSPVQSQQPMSAINWVIGRSTAESQPTVPGVETAFFDSSEPVVYLKKIGLDGKPEYFKVYDMILREDDNKEKQIDLSKYITRDEIEALIAAAAKTEVDKAISEISLKPSKPKKKGDDE